MTDITSNSNPHFRRWSELSSARGIKKHQEFILMGEKLIQEFLLKPDYKIKAEILCEGQKSVIMQSPATQNLRIPIFKLSKGLFNELDTLGTHYNLLILEPREIDSFSKQKPQGLEVIAPLGDPSNLGALVRSAVAFGASKVILTEESCNPYHPKAIKASAGALLKVALLKAGKLSDLLQDDELFVLDMVGEDVASFKWPRDIRLAIGEEGPGFGEVKGLKRLSVPTKSVESLNATVAASIALYSYAVTKKS